MHKAKIFNQDHVVKQLSQPQNTSSKLTLVSNVSQVMEMIVWEDSKLKGKPLNQIAIANINKIFKDK